jgi:hypothetical protein
VRGERQWLEDTNLSKFWKWKCEQCGHEFTLTLLEMPQACHRCDGEWFLKVGESDCKDKNPASVW